MEILGYTPSLMDLRSVPMAISMLHVGKIFGLLGSKRLEVKNGEWCSMLYNYVDWRALYQNGEICQNKWSKILVIINEWLILTSVLFDSSGPMEISNMHMMYFLQKTYYTFITTLNNSYLRYKIHMGFKKEPWNRIVTQGIT